MLSFVPWTPTNPPSQPQIDEKIQLGPRAQNWIKGSSGGAKASDSGEEKSTHDTQYEGTFKTLLFMYLELSAHSVRFRLLICILRVFVHVCPYFQSWHALPAAPWTVIQHCSHPRLSPAYFQPKTQNPIPDARWEGNQHLKTDELEIKI